MLILYKQNSQSLQNCKDRCRLNRAGYSWAGFLIKQSIDWAMTYIGRHFYLAPSGLWTKFPQKWRTSGLDLFFYTNREISASPGSPTRYWTMFWSVNSFLCVHCAEELKWLLSPTGVSHAQRNCRCLPTQGFLYGNWNLRAPPVSPNITPCWTKSFILVVENLCARPISLNVAI